MAFADPVQTNFTADAVIGSPGQLARPASPHFELPVRAEVGSGERNPRPGDAVYRDTSGGYSACATADDLRNMQGIVYLEQGTVPRPTGVTDQEAVFYQDGEGFDIVQFGFVFIAVSTTAGQTIVAGNELEYAPPAAVTGQSNWTLRADNAGNNLPSTFADLAAVRTYLATINRYIKVIAYNETAVPASSTRVVVPALVVRV